MQTEQRFTIDWYHFCLQYLLLMANVKINTVGLVWVLISLEYLLCLKWNVINFQIGLSGIIVVSKQTSQVSENRMFWCLHFRKKKKTHSAYTNLRTLLKNTNYWTQLNQIVGINGFIGIRMLYPMPISKQNWTIFANNLNIGA